MEIAKEILDQFSMGDSSSAAGSEVDHVRVNRIGERYEIVSIMGYLCGIPQDHFKDLSDPESFYPFDESVYAQLEKKPAAKLIRALCTLRRNTVVCFKKINQALMQEHRSVYRIEELNQEAIAVVEQAGIPLGSVRRAMELETLLNGRIQERIGNCQSLMPAGVLDWKYVADLFIVPGGTKPEKAKEAADLYFTYRDFFPYHAFLHLPRVPESEVHRNIFANDRVFAFWLYDQHGLIFPRKNMVSSVTAQVRQQIEDFLERGTNTVMLVDCENANMYRFCSALNDLPPENLERISKVFLIDSPNTLDDWSHFQKYTQVPVTYELNDPALVPGKSVVDMHLIAHAVELVVSGQSDSLMIISSDSDYATLVQMYQNKQMYHAQFFFFIEAEKISPRMKQYLTENDVSFCRLEDFYGGSGREVQRQAVIDALQKGARTYLQENLYTYLDETLERMHIQMEPQERQALFRNYLKSATFEVQDDGSIRMMIRGRTGSR